MSNRGAEAGNSDAERNLLVFFAPAKALSTWNPLLGVTLKGNADAQEGLGTIASEWQGFVSHRLQEDMMLTQRLAHCRTPEQILSAYADFWHKAGRLWQSARHHDEARDGRREEYGSAHAPRCGRERRK